MTPTEHEVIKRTEVRDATVVLTVRRSSAFLLRQYQTFAITATSRFAQRIADFATEAAALERHAALARDLMNVSETR